MQSSVSEPGRNKLKANWRIEFDEELDFLFGVGEGNRIKSTLFGDEEVSFELSLWNVSGGVAVEAKFICKKQMMYIYIATLELPDKTKIVATPCRGTMSNNSTCRSTFTVPGPLTQPYFKIDVVLGYYPNETERFVSRTSLRKHNAASQAASWLQSAFENRTFSDCKIQVEGREIKVHQVVLGAQSKVFEEMFTTKDTDVRRTAEIVMDDASYHAVMAMVEYLYTGSLEDVHNCVGEVYRLADKYQIDDLKDCCYEIFGKEVDEKNFCKIWSWVYPYSADEIKTMCRDFVRRHTDFRSSEEWKQFVVRNKDAALKLYDYVAAFDLLEIP